MMLPPLIFMMDPIMNLMNGLHWGSGLPIFRWEVLSSQLLLKWPRLPHLLHFLGLLGLLWALETG